MEDIKRLKKAVILKGDEVFSDAEDNSLFQEVTNEMIEEDRKAVFDKSRIKRDNDWSELANKVVGSE